jgi:hypothetical protein
VAVVVGLGGFKGSRSVWLLYLGRHLETCVVTFGEWTLSFLRFLLCLSVGLLRYGGLTWD